MSLTLRTNSKTSNIGISYAALKIGDGIRLLISEDWNGLADIIEGLFIGFLAWHVADKEKKGSMYNGATIEP